MSDRIFGPTPLRFSSFVTRFILFSLRPDATAPYNSELLFSLVFSMFLLVFFLSPRQLKHFNHRTMWDSLVRRNAFLHFSSLPPLPSPSHPPPPPSLFPPHFVSRVLKSQCKYILRGIYNSGNGGGSGSPVSAAGRRLLGLGWTCLLRLKGKNAKKGLRCRMRTRSSSIEFSSIWTEHEQFFNK